MPEFVSHDIELGLNDNPPEIPPHVVENGFDIVSKSVSLRWQIEFEMRSWGLKDVCLSVPDQKIFFDIQPYSDGDIETITIEIELKDIEADWDRTVPVSPRELEYYKGKWTLRFY